jgi:transposase
MSYYVGLDISLDSTSICIVDQEGSIFREGKTGTDPGEIRRFLESCAVPLKRVGLEAGNLSIWLYHDLLAAGVPVVCIETRHAHGVLKAQNIKTDRNDARGLAQIMRTGWFKAVHVKSHGSQKLRVLLQSRRCLLDKRLDIERQIRGTLKTFGMKTGVVTPTNYEARIRELIEDDKELRAFLYPLLVARRHMREQCLKLEKMIVAIGKKNDVCRRLMTIPGIGVLTALVFMTAIDNPQRFKKSRTVGAALGLTPRKYASGEVDYDGRVTKCGDHMTRNHLFEAAKVLLCRSQKWSALKVWGIRIAKRSSMKNACVAVAHRLAVIMHRMWVDGTEFQWGAAEEVAA